MSHVVEKLDKNRVKITITIPADEVEEGMRHTAEHMSEDTSIPGFRPGKAPYETIKARMGEMKLLEAASEELIRNTFVAAMLDEDLETVGQPYFSMEKMVPGEDMVYSAEMSLMPAVTKLADYKELSVKRESTEPTDAMIEGAIKDLLRMRTKEVRAPKGKKLEKGDKAVVNMTMKKDGVVLEGGEAQNHGVYTNETYYIEGFLEKIMGAEEGEERTFTLKFPSEHYQKHLAGQDVDFTVRLNEIFTLETPKVDDEFAKTIGLTSAEELQTKLRENLKAEKETEETRRLEKTALELLAEKSTFEEIGDLLLNQEIEKMIEELKSWVFENGMEFDKYLQSIGKSTADLKIDFAKQALTRIKVALILKEIASKESIKATEAELDEEVDKVAATVGDNKDAKEYVYSPAFRDRIENQVTNRKTIDFLLGKMVK